MTSISRFKTLSKREPGAQDGQANDLLNAFDFNHRRGRRSCTRRAPARSALSDSEGPSLDAKSSPTKFDHVADAEHERSAGAVAIVGE